MCEVIKKCTAAREYSSSGFRSGAAKAIHGFTLPEIVVGMVVASIAIALLSTLIFPLLLRSAAPLTQIRAAELAQALLDEMLAKPYDENSPLGGGACSPCSAVGLDAGEMDRSDFDDVDDYHVYCGSGAVEDVFGADLSANGRYQGFSMSICVTYDGDFDAATPSDSNTNGKRVDVVVTPPPPGNAIAVSVFRGNY